MAIAALSWESQRSQTSGSASPEHGRAASAVLDGLGDPAIAREVRRTRPELLTERVDPAAAGLVGPGVALAVVAAGIANVLGQRTLAGPAVAGHQIDTVRADVGDVVGLAEIGRISERVVPSASEGLSSVVVDAHERDSSPQREHSYSPMDVSRQT